MVLGQHGQHIDHGLTVLVQVRQTGQVLLPDGIAGRHNDDHLDLCNLFLFSKSIVYTHTHNKHNHVAKLPPVSLSDCTASPALLYYTSAHLRHLPTAQHEYLEWGGRETKRLVYGALMLVTLRGYVA